jgi:hypothetical protein
VSRNGAQRGTVVALIIGGKLVEMSGKAATFNWLKKNLTEDSNEESYSLGSDGVGFGRRFSVRGHDSEQNAGGGKPAASSGKMGGKKHVRRHHRRGGKKMANKNM